MTTNAAREIAPTEETREDVIELPGGTVITDPSDVARWRSFNELGLVTADVLNRLITAFGDDAVREALAGGKSALLADLEMAKAKNVAFETELGLTKRQNAALVRDLAASGKVNEQLRQRIRNTKHAEFGKPTMERVSRMQRKVKPGVVSRQAVHDWCVNGDIGAEQRDGLHWYAPPERFYARIEDHAIANGITDWRLPE